MNKLITTSIFQDNIVINIPVELLKFSQENREEPYVITNENEMAKYVVDKIVDFRSRGNNTDYSDFELLLDNLFEDAFENCETWLDANESWKDE